MLDKLVNSTKNILILVGLLILIPHLNIFGNQFVMDDYDYIVNWPLIQDFSNLPQFFIGYSPPPGQEGIYSPIKTLFHSINYQFFGLNPLGYHVISLIIHFLGTLMVYKITRLLIDDRLTALLATLIFCLHPTHVEAIVSMTASVDMIGIVFLFVGFYYYILHYKNEQKRILHYWLSLTFAGLAIFTHELAIALPVSYFWYNICFTRDKEPLKKTFIKILPFFGLVIFYVASKHFVLGGVNRGPYLYDSFYLTMLVVVKAMAKYVGLCLLPLTLTHNHVISEGIYSFDHTDFDQFAVLSQSIFDIQVLASLFILGTLAYFAFINFKKNPLISFCIGWFYLCLLPTSNIIPSSVYFAERYLYPGIIGFCILFSLLFKKLIDRKHKSIGIFIFLLLLSFYAGRTWMRNAEIKNDVTLFESAVRANPKSALMRNDLGLVYADYGNTEKGIESILKAIEIQNNNYEFYFSLAQVYMRAGQYDKSADALNKTIELKEDFPEAHYNLSTLYQYIGRQAESAEALHNALYYYRQQGRIEEAEYLKRVFDSYFNQQN